MSLVLGTISLVTLEDPTCNRGWSCIRNHNRSVVGGFEFLSQTHTHFRYLKKRCRQRRVIGIVGSMIFCSTTKCGIRLWCRAVTWRPITEVVIEMIFMDNTSHWGQIPVFRPGTSQIHCNEMDSVPALYRPSTLWVHLKFSKSVSLQCSWC